MGWEERDIVGRREKTCRPSVGRGRVAVDECSGGQATRVKFGGNSGYYRTRRGASSTKHGIDLYFLSGWFFENAIVPTHGQR